MTCPGTKGPQPFYYSTMGSLGTGEIMIIVLVALIVFGPQRLPEITRKAGEFLAKAREMTKSVTDTIDAEYGDIAAPIRELKGEYDSTMSDVKGLASSMPDLSVELPEIGLSTPTDSVDDPTDSVDADDRADPPPGEEAS